MANSLKTCQISRKRPMAVGFNLLGWSMAKVQCCYGTKPQIIAYKLSKNC